MGCLERILLPLSLQTYHDLVEALLSIKLPNSIYRSSNEYMSKMHHECSSDHGVAVRCHNADLSAGGASPQSSSPLI